MKEPDPTTDTAESHEITESSPLKERDALLDRLALEIHRSSDVRTVTRAATEALARLLDADRCLFFTVREAEDIIEPVHEFLKPGVPSALRRYALSEFRELVRVVRDQGVLAIADVENDPLTRPYYSRVYQPLGTRSALYAAVEQDGVLKAITCIGIVNRQRSWNPSEINLVRTVTHHIGIALRQAELIEHLHRSEERYREMFEKAVVGMYQSTPEGKILAANPALVKMLGYDSLDELLQVDIERTLYLDPAVRRRNIAELHRTGRLTGVQFALKRKNGTVVIVEEHARAVTDRRGKVLYYEGTLIDVTEKKALERQLVQAQRLESVGTLAAGVAHHFNNLLTVILGYASLLLGEASPGDPRWEALMQIEQAAKRAAELTTQLLTFSRQISTRPARINLNVIVEKVVRFLRPTFDPTITIHLKKADDLWPIVADPAQIEQAVVNLCINARDAMPLGGTLTLETENRLIDAHTFRPLLGEARSGEFVALSVSDTGVGIAEENLRRIFDPFFTTKEVGRGTGLGLAIVYGVVRSFEGLIDVESKPGAGTRITLLFPAAPIESGTPDSPMPDPGSSSARRTLLIVDDEPAVVRVAQAILHRYGFQTLTASDAAEALETYQQRVSDIDIVILDLTMPKMSGIMCYRWLTRINPQVKVILSSGYNSENIDQDILTAPNIRFVQKPYVIEELLNAINQLLEPEAASG
ncbi:MAG TPA: response regulator [Blastocatellia bacterium]|nr:response regulator [Blastocatellia bacterium]